MNDDQDDEQDYDPDPYIEGRNAWRQGEPLRANPYKPGTLLSNDWSRGWYAADD